MDIKESNKMIAEFMGYKYFPYDPKRKSDGDYIAGWHKNTIGSPKIPNWYLARRTPELRFSNEWNWLMPVVEKIRTLCHAHYGDTDKMGLIFRSIMMVDIVCAYKYVVEFIMGYNTINEVTGKTQ